MTTAANERANGSHNERPTQDLQHLGRVRLSCQARIGATVMNMTKIKPKGMLVVL